MFFKWHVVCAFFCLINAAVVPPPWTDPVKNPCASMPGGWQLLYWPPLKRCFKIFNIGFPCPDTMELAPITYTAKKLRKSQQNNSTVIAECRCPPGTAMSHLTNKCYKIFERGPCDKHEYFSPIPADTDIHSNTTSIRWGICKRPAPCDGAEQVFWPADGKCYTQYSRGPCFKGKLLVLNADQLAECKCENSKELQEYYYAKEDTCHELYTKGPCLKAGRIFLPGGNCDCFSHLPNYHQPSQMCYELDTIGPCPAGHIFIKLKNETHAQCRCKDGYVRWTDGNCYRLYTRGPCTTNEFLVNATTCSQRCDKNRLYFPEQKSGYRIGSQGPCPLYQVVVFDFNARPSIDGIPYNGVCGCLGILKDLGLKCEEPIISTIITTTSTTAITPLNWHHCDINLAMVMFKGNCYRLYTQGPCATGQWLEPVPPRTIQIERNVPVVPATHPRSM